VRPSLTSWPTLTPPFYREHIWPQLAAVKLDAIMEATGYSKGHCSTIGTGTRAPQVSTWPARAALVGVDVRALRANT